MKVVLLEDIKGLGIRGDVCAVSGGYAMNFLIPKKKAVADGDPGGKRIVAQREQADLQRSERKEREDDMMAHLPEKITVRASANDKGTLFSAVTAAAITQRLLDDGIDAPESWFHHVAIKEVGEHPVSVRHDGTERMITIAVERADTTV